MALVEIYDYGPGKPTVKVYDDCIYKTQEEIDRTLTNVYNICIQDQINQAIRARKEQERAKDEQSKM